MVKLEYKVLKGFSIIKDENGVRQIAEPTSEEQATSTFLAGSSYVDYEFPDYKIKEGDITAKLVKAEYIKLINSTTTK